MENDRHFMNKQHGQHMAGGEDGKEKGGKSKHPSIHIHSHAKGHTVHIMHPDGAHEKHEHGKGDADGIAEHIHNHLGSGGQDHGVGDGAGDLMGDLGVEA